MAISLTPQDRQKLIDAGIIKIPPKIVKGTYHTQIKWQRALPAKFDGTPKERADKCVEYAKTKNYCLAQCLLACGYPACSSGSLKEILNGGGPAIEACRKGPEIGIIGWYGNRGNLRIIRDYYGIEKVHGANSPDDDRIREVLIDLKGYYETIAANSNLHVASISDFVYKKRNGMKRVTRERVWRALEILGLYKR